MAAAASDEFEAWLSKKLLSLNPEVDLEVFVEYIRSILETETDNEEIVDSITGFLEQITEDDLSRHCEEITAEWVKISNEENEAKKEAGEGKLSLEDKMHCIIEEQMKAATNNVSKSSVDRAQKAAILAQYAQVSDGEETDNGDDEVDPDDANFVKNFNAQVVVQKQQQEREKAKATAEKKRQKDKEDREKQKQKAQERKENEKKRTQKGEKRR